MKKSFVLNPKWLGLMSAVVIASGAYAANTVKTGKPAGKAPASAPVITEAQYDKDIKDAEERGRHPAASSDSRDVTLLSDDLNNLRNEIIGGKHWKDGKEDSSQAAYPGISSHEQMRTFLEKLNDDNFYNGLAPDAQFAAAQMAPLLTFDGFFNRVKDLLKTAPLSHMAAVTALRTLAASAVVYLPSDQSNDRPIDQWRVGLEFVAVPTDKMGSYIDNEDQVHTFIESELGPSVLKMKERIRTLNFAKKPVYLDNRIFYGRANFANDHDQFMRIGEPERNLVLASAELTLSGLQSLNAYNLNGLFTAVDQLSQEYGFKSGMSVGGVQLGRFDPSVATAKKRYEILRKVNASKGLFNLRDNAQSWMDSAYDNLAASVYHTELAWAEIKKRSNERDGDSNFLDPRGFAPFIRVIGAGLSNMHYIAPSANNPSSKSELRSAVISTDGQRVELASFYHHAPASLTSLYPTGFDDSPYTLSAKLKRGTREYHNFYNGRPTAWNLTEYSKLLPGVTNNDQLKGAARVLAQTWGGWMVGLPLSALML